MWRVPSTVRHMREHVHTHAHMCIHARTHTHIHTVGGMIQHGCDSLWVTHPLA